MRVQQGPGVFAGEAQVCEALERAVQPSFPPGVLAQGFHGRVGKAGALKAFRLAGDDLVGFFPEAGDDAGGTWGRGAGDAAVKRAVDLAGGDEAPGLHDVLAFGGDFEPGAAGDGREGAVEGVGGAADVEDAAFLAARVAPRPGHGALEGLGHTPSVRGLGVTRMEGVWALWG